MLGVGIEILLVIILVLINGVRSMSELAVVSARRARMEQRASSRLEMVDMDANRVDKVLVSRQDSAT